MPFLILTAIVIAIGIYFISVQRNLVKIDELCQNALSQIGVQQTSRWDALSQLAKATKAYAQHESETLIETISQRRSTGLAGNAQEIQAQDQAMNSVLSRLIAVAENYPDLKASQVYRDTMASIDSYENKVRTSRMVYNDTITKLNRLVKQFPSNLVASVLGYQAKPYLEVSQEKAQMPDLDF